MANEVGRDCFNRDSVRELSGKTCWILTHCGKLYITTNYNGDQVVEVFFNLGKSGNCAMSHLAALGKTISIYLQDGGDINRIAKNLLGVKCPKPVFDPEYGLVESCSDAIAQILIGITKKKVSATGEHLLSICAECGSNNVSFESKCMTCQNCGYSTCG